MSKQYKDAKKRDGLLLGPLHEHLLARPRDYRDPTVLHPSEVAKNAWCPRAAYHQIAGSQVYGDKSVNTSLEMNLIFQNGHDIHDKYQNWWWDMGVLEGVFKCYNCDWESWAISPPQCPDCMAPRECMRYMEVPIYSDRYLLGGHGDAKIGTILVEIKGLGLGTLRLEHPDLVDEHTHRVVVNGKERTWTDIEGLWRNIKQPLPSHLRQAFLYKACLPDIRQIVVIYEFKPNQQVKEFVIIPDAEMLQERLDQCEQVKYALEIGEPPGCLDLSGRCPECSVYYEVKDGPEAAVRKQRAPRRQSRWLADEGGDAGGRERGLGGGVEEDRSARPVVASSALRLRRPVSANGPDQPGRSRIDDAIQPPSPLAGIFRRAASDGGDLGERH